ncbi:flagellar L-ring protein [Salmonella enterica subsp. enterica]|nr:flagellar L-ring protein [Salmonella enterica subsp. enterica]
MGDTPTGSLILKMKVMQKYALHAYPVMALMVATLTGCAWIPAKPLVQGADHGAADTWPGTGGEWLHNFSLRSRLIMAISRFLKIVDRVISAIRSRLCYRKTSAPVKARRQMPAATAKPSFGFDTVPRYLQGLFGNSRADMEALRRQLF